MYLSIENHDPKKIALIDAYGVQATYGELIAHCQGIHSKLVERPVVFALADNTVGFASYFFALLNHGAIPLLLPADLSPQLLTDLESEYQPAYYLLPSKLEADHPGIIHSTHLDYCLKKTNYVAYATHEKLELLLSTSGSTGSPKLVRFKRGNMAVNAANVVSAFQWTAQERGVLSLPLNYVMGLNVFFAHLLVGATGLLTSANLLDSAFWNFIREQRATNFTGVPFSYEVLLRLRPQNMNLPDLKTFAQGGGKLTERTFKKMGELARQNNWQFIPTYGTTETAARCTLLAPDLVGQKILSIGKAIPHVEVLLVNELKEPLSQPDRIGELVIRGENVAMGYAQSKRDLLKGDEWQGVYYTGDLGYFDHDGYFYITGRKKRFTKLLGNRIGLDECELLLKKEFSIEIACTAKDDQLHIFCEFPELTEQLKNYLANTLHLQPTLFQSHYRQKLPRSESGKILYQELELDVENR